ncbi:protein MgtR, partial [Salmonella enterica]|nr:protein MgtR [Salmonella enterica]EEL1270929.1 protein MgtR [Salmonella enterica]ELX2462697.1 protein MgtR [Salmonella enterica]
MNRSPDTIIALIFFL